MDIKLKDGTVQEVIDQNAKAQRLWQNLKMLKAWKISERN